MRMGSGVGLTSRRATAGSSNLLASASDYTTATWIKWLGVTVAANAGTAPDGSNTAQKMIAPVSTGSQRAVGQTIATTIGRTYTFTAKVKPAGFNWCVVETDIANCYGAFNASTGAKGTLGAAAATSSIAALANGFYACTITFVATATSTQFRVWEQDNDTSVNWNCTGDGVKGILLAGVSAI